MFRVYNPSSVCNITVEIRNTLITFDILKYQLNLYYQVSRITNDFSESIYLTIMGLPMF